MPITITSPIERTVSEYLARDSADSGYLTRITEAYFANTSVYCLILIKRLSRFVMTDAPELLKFRLMSLGNLLSWSNTEARNSFEQIFPLIFWMTVACKGNDTDVKECVFIPCELMRVMSKDNEGIECSLPEAEVDDIPETVTLVGTCCVDNRLSGELLVTVLWLDTLVATIGVIIVPVVGIFKVDTAQFWRVSRYKLNTAVSVAACEVIAVPVVVILFICDCTGWYPVSPTVFKCYWISLPTVSIICVIIDVKMLCTTLFIFKSTARSLLGITDVAVWYGLDLDLFYATWFCRPKLLLDSLFFPAFLVYSAPRRQNLI